MWVIFLAKGFFVNMDMYFQNMVIALLEAVIMQAKVRLSHKKL